MKYTRPILYSLGILVGLVLFVALVLWFFPGMAINTQTVRWLAHKQTSFRFEPQFPQDFEFQIRNSKIFGQKVHLKATKFCIHAVDESMKACFDQLDASAAVDFRTFRMKFDRVGPIDIQAPSIEIASTDKEPKEKTKKDKSTFDIPRLTHDFTVEKVQIDLPNVILKSPKSQMKGSFVVKGDRAGGDDFQLSAEAKLLSDKDPKNITANLNVTMNPGFDIDGNLKAHIGTDKKKPNIDLDSNIHGNLKKEQGELRGKVLVAHATSFIPLLEIQRFRIIKTEKVTAEGDFTVEFMLGSLNNPKKSALPPPEFKTKFSGKVEAEQTGKEPIKFAVDIQPLEQYGMKAEAKVKGTYVTKKSLLDLDILSVSFVIDEFQQTVRGLRKTQMAIPAPINEMNGSIDLHIGEEKISKSAHNTFTIPIKFTTNLSSQKQRLITETTGSLVIQTPPFQGKLKLDVALKEIAIQTPDFDPISRVPTVVGDKRFVKKQKDIKVSELFKDETSKKTEPSAFTTEIHVTTPDQPIRIYYKLFKPAAIFRVKTNIGGKNPGFNVKFEPFEVSYLKRNAKLERLNISDDDETQSMLLDGKLSMKKADYDIYADIHQESKKTTIVLSSNPPLSEDDIISLILFNELASELDSTSTDSVENTEAAMTKRSIGFLSFFVLSSTPVESVNYDPSTNQYSARVKLPGGFTGTVGSDWDRAQEVGLRKRLGGSWVISATTGTDPEGKSVQESMIEWYHRY